MLTSLFAIIFLGVVIFLYLYASNIVNKNQEELLMHELNDVIVDVDNFFSSIIVTIDNVVSYVQTNPNDQELLNYLMIIDQSQTKVVSIYLGRSDKTMVNSSGFIPGPSFDLTTRPWYIAASQSDQTVFTPAFMNATEDRIIMNVAKSVYINDQFIGVVSADIDITTISLSISRTTVRKSGFAILMDSNHHLVAFPGMNMSYELTAFNDKMSTIDLTKTNELLYNVSYYQTQGVMVISYVLDDDYIVGVFVPNVEFYEASTMLLYIFILLLIFVIILGTGLIFINQYFILQPIKMLVSDIGIIDISNRPNYRIPNSERLGYAPIRIALNHVLDVSSKYLKEKEDARSKLLLENQRVMLLMNSAADIIFEINLQREYINVLGRGLDKIGMKSTDYIGKTVIEVFGDQGKNRDYHYQRALEGHHTYYYWDYKTMDGIIHFESSISPIYDEQKNIVGAVGISRDITEQQIKQQEIEHVSTHDFLTGLYNRRYFGESLTLYDQEEYYPLGIMMMDLNGLKMLNDAYGHTFGDQALVEVGYAISNCLHENEIATRIGGDEFAIILPNTSEDRIYDLKKKISERITQISIANVHLSIAIGYALKVCGRDDMDAILKEAEDYMYRLKLAEGMSFRNNSIKAILKTLTDKYKDERLHLEKVSLICREMGKLLGLTDDQVRELEYAGLYHDIGKISIPDQILDKPGKLTASEYEIMKTHTEAGYQILRAADAYSNIAEYALTHHERWDGKGYPRGLKEKDIPYFSRIISIVDAYEAMTSKRVYKDEMTKQEAIDEIIRCSGTQFDPDLAKVFVTQFLKSKWIESKSEA